MSKQVDRAELGDDALIGLVRGKDDQLAWEELMRRHASKAYYIAYGILGQKDDAEEVTQDAFVRIYRALEKFRGDSEFSTWMYRIVVNQARNRYRWNKRRGAHLNVSINQELELDDSSTITLDVPDTGKTPDREVMFRELEKEISREMETLPEVNREALILRNVQNLSYEQIAELLDCKIGTVKSRIARAREELRKRLRDDG
jgi:RNA polymerase sigma-70 factor, ECF subfamily